MPPAAACSERRYTNAVALEAVKRKRKREGQVKPIYSSKVAGRECGDDMPEAIERILRAAGDVKRNELNKQDELKHSTPRSLWMATMQWTKYFGVSKNSFTSLQPPQGVRLAVSHGPGIP